MEEIRGPAMISKAPRLDPNSHRPLIDAWQIPGMPLRMSAEVGGYANSC